jgi:hypothetical protein
MLRFLLSSRRRAKLGIGAQALPIRRSFLQARPDHADVVALICRSRRDV